MSAIVRLPYEAAWTSAAVRSVLESLPWLAARGIPLRVAALRNLAKDRAGQLAWLQWLAAQNVSYRVAPTPWSHLAREPVWVPGRRLFLYTTLVSHRAAIRRLRRIPQAWLAEDLLAVVPEPRWDTADAHPEDWLVFAVMLALVPRTSEEWCRVREKGLPLLLGAVPPTSWYALPRAMRLQVAYDGPGPLPVRVYGQTTTGFDPLTQRLLPGRNLQLGERWHGVYLLCLPRPPQGRLTLRLMPSAWRETIPPTAWESLWLYGLEVALVGYLPRRAFRQQARRYPAGAFQAPGSRSAYPFYGLPVAALRPMEDLLSRLNR